MSHDQYHAREAEFYFANFGRYEGNRPAEYPANEFLVGREKQRAELLKHLFSAGRRGAYLITGHRGSGKTSFVRHCIAEYADDLYQRYLQRNVGRSFFWDRFGQLCLVALLVFSSLVFSELLAHLIEVEQPGIVRFPAIILLVIALSYPWMAAYRLFHIALEFDTEFGPRPIKTITKILRARRPTALPLAVLAACILSTLALLPLADPVASLAHSLFILSFFAAATQALSFVGERENEAGASASVECDDPSLHLDSLVDARPFRWWAPSIAFVLGVSSSIVLYLFPDSVGHPRVLCNYSVGLLGFAAAGRLRLLRNRGLPTGSASNASLKSAARWYTYVMLMLSLCSVAMAFLGVGRLNVVLLVGAVVLAIASITWGFSSSPHWAGENEHSFRFNPRPRLLILVKGFLLSLIGCHLLFPMLAWFFDDWNIPSSPGSMARITSMGPTVLFPRVTDGASALAIGMDIRWCLLVVAIVMVLDALEFEWIVRPLSKLRQDHSLHRLRLDAGNEDGYRGSRLRNRFRRLSRETLFWRIYSVWLPVLVVPVNLGFDSLDQRLVVEAMLAGLRNAYRRTFLHWSGLFTSIRRGLTIFAVLIASIWLGQALFGIPAGPQQEALDGRVYCEKFVPGTGSTPDSIVKTTSWLTCKLGGEQLLQALHWSPMGSGGGASQQASVSRPGHNAMSSLFRLGEHGRDDFFDFPAYLLLCVSIIAFVGFQISRRWGLPPYRQLDHRMGEILDSLSRTLREESRPQSSPLATWLRSLSGREIIQQKEGGPLDPRTVELNFLNVLCDMQDAGYQFPLGSKHRISPPIPEVIFVFDELDKMGSGFTESLAAERDEEITEPLDQERERSRSLHQLFADLKNTICGGEARFIFIGGRNLHDEWLADQTARRPLLTYIFDLELYIPSLLTDFKDPSAHDLPGIKAFMWRQKFRATEAYQRSRNKRLRPWLTAWVEELQPPTFIQVPATNDFAASMTGSADTEWPKLVFYSSKSLDEVQPSGRFAQEFYEFLAYRSKGNVKRVKELLESFLDPRDYRHLPARVGSSQEARSTENQRLETLDDVLDCDHILAFGEWDRFRIQLVAELYRNLVPILDPRIRLGDDKIPQAIMYLSDFLLKFHRRAFAWSNVERVDELVHIHRAPDLRRAMKRILEVSSGRFLHRIRNGMYDFRCNSDFARELVLLSRWSDQELAAVNFTLDESQFLKAIYRSRLRILGEDEGVDFVSGLADLHKFDEEFELARSYYRKAIAALDERFRKDMGWLGADNPVFYVLRQSSSGKGTLRARLGWGIARLRLMLQVGVSFERSRDLERALAEYREARTLGDALVMSLSEGGEDANNVPNVAFLSDLEQINLLFQPFLAESWVAEKLASGVDTSVGMIESELWRLRKCLPSVGQRRNELKPAQTSPIRPSHISFTLVLSELHNKAGDLLFFKGRQLVPLEYVESWASPNAERNKTEGYLLRAIYHYNVAIHEIRRFNAARRRHSSVRLGLPTRRSGSSLDGEGHGKPETRVSEAARAERREVRGESPLEVAAAWETIELEGWSDFVLLSAAGSIADLADAYLSLFSFTGLIRSIQDAALDNRADCKDPKNSADDGLDGFSFSFAQLTRSRQDSGQDNVPVLEERKQHDEVYAERQIIKEAYKEIVAWLESSDEQLRAGDNREPSKWGHCLSRLFEGYDFKGVQLSDWLGLPCEGENADDGQHRLLGPGVHNTHCERLASGLLLSFVAGSILRRGRHYEAAGCQFQRVAEAVAACLWWRNALYACFAHGLPASKMAEFKFLNDMDILSFRGRDSTSGFFIALARIGYLAIGAAEDCFTTSRCVPQPGPKCALGDRYAVGFEIPSTLFTATCSIALALEIDIKETQTAAEPLVNPSTPIEEEFQTRSDEILRRLATLVNRWTGDGSTAVASIEPRRGTFKDLLDESIQRRSYPMINQLRARKVLIDYSLLKPRAKGPFGDGSGHADANEVDYEKGDEAGEVEHDSDLDEIPGGVQAGGRGEVHHDGPDRTTRDELVKLWELQQRYDSDLHFTPMDIGFTTALPCLLFNTDGQGWERTEDFPSLDSLRLQALEELYKSEEMYTMRASYYEAIDDLYYLYDDFNDRTVHFHHALQMAGAEIVAFFIRTLERTGRSQRER